MLSGLLLTKAKSSHAKAAVGVSRFDNTGNFSQFSGTFLVHLQHTCFYEIILHNFIIADFTDKSTCD